MIKKLLVLLVPLLLLGCKDKSSTITTYSGVVVERNSLNPIPGLTVTITDGSNIFSETNTNDYGQFSINLAQNSSLGHLYLFIDGCGVYPSLNMDLIYTEDEKYDYGLVYLYNQTDASLYPVINKVDWDYPYGGGAMRFKDVEIKSDYSLSDAFVEFSKNENFATNEKYQLEKQDNGKYSVVVNNLMVGERYYFRVVASNNVGTGRSEVYTRVFGMPIPLIMELKNATVNSATISMCVSEDPMTTLSAGLCWSTSHNPSANNNIESGGTSGISDVTINGLNFYTTTYYVRAYAQNANGITYSEELALPVNNPFSLPTFTSGGYTYSYKYLDWGTWYTAYNACASFVYVFDDWILPDYDMIVDLFNTYYTENGEAPPLPLWSRARDEDLENGESDTFMLTNNGYIWAPKKQSANYYAVRRF